MRRCSGAPRAATNPARTSTRSSAVQVRPTRMARASRVCSSTMLASFSLRPSVVSSNWKSIAQTWLGRWARSRSACSGATRRRLRVRAGRRRPSSRHNRRMRLWFTPDQEPPALGAAPARPSASPTEDAPGRCGAAGLAVAPPRPHRPPPVDAGWCDAGRRPDRRGVGTPRSGPAGAPRPCGAAPGSEVSLGQLLEHVDVQRLVGDQPLEPGVLGLQLLEPLGRTGLHPAVLGPPAVPGRLADLQRPQDLGQVLAVVEQPLALADLPDCLLRGVPVSLHVIVLLPTVWAIGLSQRLDQLQGLTSARSAPLLGQRRYLAGSTVGHH